MSKWCITTVVSANHFQYYVPMFIFAAKHAYPEAFVMVYVIGSLKPEVKTLLQSESFVKECGDGWKIQENAFGNVPMLASTCNSLRQLLPENDFAEFKYLYVTDVDILMFRHEPSHVKKFAAVMKRTGLPIAAYRGPLKAKSNGLKCTGINTRIACYSYLVNLPDWWNTTRKARNIYLKLISESNHDAFDNTVPCSYREYDEVMLHRICRLSGIPSPKEVGRFHDGSRIKALYKDIHLGDFKFNKRWKKKARMTARIHPDNIKAYKELRVAPGWQDVLNCCCTNDDIDTMIDRLHAHVAKREEK